MVGKFISAVICLIAGYLGVSAEKTDFVTSMQAEVTMYTAFVILLVCMIGEDASKPI